MSVLLALSWEIRRVFSRSYSLLLTMVMGGGGRGGGVGGGGGGLYVFFCFITLID